MMDWLRNLFKSKEDKKYDYISEKINDPDYDVLYKDGKIVVEHHPERKIERDKFNALSPGEKNEIGRRKGFGTCSHCGGTWNWKHGHTIPYTESGHSGMFPLCDECYEKLSPQTRYEYCVKLWSTWGSPEDKVNWDIVKKHVGLMVGSKR